MRKAKAAVGYASARNCVKPSATSTLGLAVQFDERGPIVSPGSTTNGTIVSKAYTWATDSSGNVYVGTVVSTAYPNGSALQSKSVQVLDVDGNLTQQQAFDFGI